VVISVVIFLKENSSSSDKRCIGGNSKLLLGVRDTEDGSSAEGFFDFGYEGSVFLYKINKGSGKIREVGNELSIEVTEADKGANISEFLWSRPFGNSF